MKSSNAPKITSFGYTAQTWSFFLFLFVENLTGREGVNEHPVYYDTGM